MFSSEFYFIGFLLGFSNGLVFLRNSAVGGSFWGGELVGKIGVVVF